MLDTLSFPTEWTEISAVLIPKCVGPQGLKDYRPLASLCAIRKLLGYVWMLSLPRELPWRSFQAAFLPGVTPLRRFFWCNAVASYQKSSLLPNWTSKKAFDKAKHSAISDALLSKGVSPHHVAILNSLWSQSSMLFKLAHLRAARDVKAHRGVPQGSQISVGVHHARG